MSSGERLTSESTSPAFPASGRDHAAESQSGLSLVAGKMNFVPEWAQQYLPGSSSVANMANSSQGTGISKPPALATSKSTGGANTSLQDNEKNGSSDDRVIRNDSKGHKLAQSHLSTYAGAGRSGSDRRHNSRVPDESDFSARPIRSNLATPRNPRTLTRSPVGNSAILPPSAGGFSSPNETAEDCEARTVDEQKFVHVDLRKIRYTHDELRSLNDPSLPRPDFPEFVREPVTETTPPASSSNDDHVQESVLDRREYSNEHIHGNPRPIGGARGSQSRIKRQEGGSSQWIGDDTGYYSHRAPRPGSGNNRWRSGSDVFENSSRNGTITRQLYPRNDETRGTARNDRWDNLSDGPGQKPYGRWNTFVSDQRRSHPQSPGSSRWAGLGSDIRGGMVSSRTPFHSSDTQGGVFAGASGDPRKDAEESSKLSIQGKPYDGLYDEKGTFADSCISSSGPGLEAMAEAAEKFAVEMLQEKLDCKPSAVQGVTNSSSVPASNALNDSQMAMLADIIEDPNRKIPCGDERIMHAESRVERQTHTAGVWSNPQRAQYRESGTGKWNPSADPTIALHSRPEHWTGDTLDGISAPAHHRHGKVPSSAPLLPPLSAHPERWYYRDPQGKIQGPFLSEEMRVWLDAGYFSMNLLIRREGDTGPFLELGRLFPNNDAFLPQLNPNRGMEDMHQRNVVFWNREVPDTNAISAKPTSTDTQSLDTAQPLDVTHSSDGAQRQDVSHSLDYAQSHEMAPVPSVEKPIAETDAEDSVQVHIPVSVLSDDKIEPKQTKKPEKTVDFQVTEENAVYVAESEGQEEEVQVKHVNNARKAVLKKSAVKSISNDRVRKQNVKEKRNSRSAKVDTKATKAVPPVLTSENVVQEKQSSKKVSQAVPSSEIDTPGKSAGEIKAIKKSDNESSWAARVGSTKSSDSSGSAASVPCVESRKATRSEEFQHSIALNAKGNAPSARLDLGRIIHGQSVVENRAHDQDVSSARQNEKSAWGTPSSRVETNSSKSLAAIQEEELKLSKQLESTKMTTSGRQWASKVGSAPWGTKPQTISKAQQPPKNQAASFLSHSTRSEKDDKASDSQCSGGTASDTFGVAQDMSIEFRRWCESQVKKLSADMSLMEFCYTLVEASDIREYLHHYLGSTPVVSAFASEFILRKQSSQQSARGRPSVPAKVDAAGFVVASNKKNARKGKIGSR